MPKFILEIDLGNEGMISSPDIGRALRDVADSVDNGSGFYPQYSTIRDINGNVVGKYEVI